MRWSVIGVAAGLLACGIAHAKRFTDPAAGISIEKPDDWSVLPPEAIAKDRVKVATENTKLREALESYASRPPLFAFTRVRGSYRGLATTVKIGTVAAGNLEGQSGQQALEALVEPVGSVMSDMKVVTAPEPMSLAGRRAGHMSFISTLEYDHLPLSVAFEMWAVPQGNHFLLLAATYPANDQTGDRAAVMKLINSLKFSN